jgi:hypothetical protein
MAANRKDDAFGGGVVVVQIVAVDTALVDSGWAAADTTGSTSEDRVFQGVRRSSFGEESVHRESWATFPWPSGGIELEETAAVASEGLDSAGMEGKRSQDMKTTSVAVVGERDMWD